MKRVAVLLLAFLPVLAAQRVTVVAPGSLPAPAKYGIKVLESMKTTRDLYVTAELRDLGTGPQSFTIRKTTHAGRPAIALAGSDGVGLMYAALDVAEQGEARESTERPFLLERGVSMYTMQRAYFESRLYDEKYWQRYFDLLARSRINTFTIIFGYENGGFMAPLYPYFFDTPGHPEVKFVGLTPAQQAHNTAAFHALMRIAHERGIVVTGAIWDHIYRGGVQSGGISGASSLVTGLTTENLAPYTKAAMRQFLETFPEIDGLELRMHNESGLKPSEMPAFWHEMFVMLHQFKPDLRLTLRAKELPDSIIEDAIAQGFHPRLETKYWMEQMGLPFHPTHINVQDQQNRRHGYADLLRYPQEYNVHWRLWTGGTARLLLWGDPEYVRRYARSAKLYGGDSMEVNEMLATKMLGEAHDAPPRPILNAKYRYYDYEFERYWHFYQLWGRLTYNPDTPSSVWEREFQRRFGAAGSSLMLGLQRASQVLPRIVAAAYGYQYFPTTRGWAEMMRQGDLPEFAKLQGSDIEQFESPRDAAQGGETSKRRPEETARWFAAASSDILKQVHAAEPRARTSEAISTITDLRILAWLAKYYAERLPAAVAYNAHAYDAAASGEARAIAAWEQIVKAAGDVYSTDLAFGAHEVGFPRHWKEELPRLQRGLAALPKGAGALPARAAGAPPRVQLLPGGDAQPDEDYLVEGGTSDAAAIKSLRLRYRHLTQFEDYRTVEMTLDPATGLFRAHIPGDFIIPKWDLIYFVEAIGKNGAGRNYPDLEAGDPYVIVPVVRRGNWRRGGNSSGIVSRLLRR